MPGFANLRDLGGLPVVGGGTTRPGMLFRSDAPYTGDDDPDGLAGWPPSTVVDLRSRAEHTLRPRSWPTTTRVIQHELCSAARLDRFSDGGDLLSVYLSILAEAPRRLAAIPTLLDPTGSTLVHCTAGKDRTGVAAIVLLLLAGVEPDAIVADYQRTRAAMTAVIARMRDVGLFPAEFVDAPLDWLDAPEVAGRLVVEELTSSLGGPRGWYLSHGGEIQALDNWTDRFVASGRLVGNSSAR